MPKPKKNNQKVVDAHINEIWAKYYHGLNPAKALHALTIKTKDVCSWREEYSDLDVPSDDDEEELYL